MAASGFFTTTTFVNRGRSGYNKENSDDDDNMFVNWGRSGYNKDDKDDEDNN
ncbi:hypothetical protein VTJ49DRAFT_3436 [Mycothermus thermophilus]|uniref:Uncharacterized protein n=1 Tax=Humicola insolens TaxID=85995 RepID=A0ABR3V7H6_HUMIN